MMYTLEDAQERVLKACRRLCEEGLIARTWGNVSARLSESEFLITPSGRDYETMTAEDLVRVGIKDQKWEGDLKPSSEKGMHAGLYQLRPECGFIIHTHQSNASAVSVLGEHIDLTSLSARVFTKDPEREILGDAIPCASYGLSSTKKLAKNVVKTMRDHPGSKAVLMRYHGAVCLGADDEEAFGVAECLETVCGRIYEKRTGEKLAAGQGMNSRYQVHEKNGLYRVHTWTPYIMEMSRRGRTVMPYLDDLAQIGGPSIRCIPEFPEPGAFRSACKGRNAVLIRNDGAICIADTPEEAEAVAIVLEKNCQAANLALKKGLPPVDPVSTHLERTVYLQKYAKLKNKAADEEED